MTPSAVALFVLIDSVPASVQPSILSFPENGVFGNIPSAKGRLSRAAFLVFIHILQEFD